MQEVLDTPALLPRMQKVLTLLKKEIEVAKLQNQIRDEVNHSINDRQREFFLREQLKVKPIEPPTPRAQRSVEEKKYDSDLRKKKKQIEADYLNLVAFVNNRRVRNP